VSKKKPLADRYTRHADGVDLSLPWRKNDQEAHGTTVWLPARQTDLRPVTGLERWLAASGITEGPLFRRLWRLPPPREVEFNARLRAFAKHWGFRPHACAPYRARTKGKDERGVGYVKKNAIAGRRFESWSALEAHLEGWMRDVADQRVHGTTGEVPIERFRRAEAGALRSIAGIPPFERARELVRKVQADCVIEVDSNAYSVPWRLIGESVRVVITGDQLRINHAGREVAVHHCQTGRFAPVVDPVHFDGVVGSGAKARLATGPACEPVGAGELLRPLLEYERAVGGRW
jgi:hypothetical protein